MRHKSLEAVRCTEVAQKAESCQKKPKVVQQLPSNLWTGLGVAIRGAAPSVRKTLLIFPQDDRFYYVCVLKNREFVE